MKRRINLASIFLLAALAGALSLNSGCTSGIPIFDPKATTLNRVASAEELLIETNQMLGQLRADGILTQQQIDASFTPQLVRAKAIILSVRMVARASTTQPTSQPIGSIDEAKNILKGVRATLLQLQKGKT